MERGKFPPAGAARIYDDGREYTRARYARKKEREKQGGWRESEDKIGVRRR